MPTNPYSAPWLQATFVPTHRVLYQLGFHEFTPLAEIWPNVRQGDQERLYDENQNLDISPITDPDDVVSAAGFASLKLKGTPALVLERNTGAVLLRPEPRFQSTTLNDNVRWVTGDNQAPKWAERDNAAAPWHKGRQITHLERKIWWNVVAPGTSGQQGEAGYTGDLNNRFAEVPLVRSPHAPSAKLPDRDSATNNAIVGIQYRQKPDEGDDPPVHWLQSEFQLMSSENFFIAVRIEPPGAHTKLKQGLPFVEFQWGDAFGLRFNIQGVQFADTADKAANANFKDIAGFNRGRFLQKSEPDWYFLLIQVVGNSIVIQDAREFIGSDTRDRESRGFAHTVLQGAATGLVIPPAKMKVGFCGVGAKFCWFPCVRAKTGTLKMIVGKEMGYAPANPLRVQMHYWPDPDAEGVTPAMVNAHGKITGTADTDGFGTSATYTWEAEFKIADDRRRDRSPELYSLGVDAYPAFETVTMPDWGFAGGVIPQSRILRANIQLGVVEQTATIDCDNRDGKFKDIEGVYPFEIRCGWKRRNGTYEPSPDSADSVRLTGYCTRVVCSKKADTSIATLSIVGRKLQLDEAQAVNMPIYDGFYDCVAAGDQTNSALHDILRRAGYDHTTFGLTVQTEPGKTTWGSAIIQFELPLPLPGEQPLYNFTMGTSIWQCLQTIAQVTGYWLFFDHLGWLHYVNPFTSPTADYVFREIPGTNDGGAYDYDEVYGLTIGKETDNVRNAVMAMGLDAAAAIPSPIVTVEKTNLTVPLADGYVPWWRWVFITDARLNNPDIVEWVAGRTFENAKRTRVVARCRSWGGRQIGPDTGRHLRPLDMVNLQIRTGTHSYVMPTATGLTEVTPETVDAKSGLANSLFRVLSTTDTFDFARGAYETDYELEYHDPNWEVGPWWGADGF